MSVLVQNRFGNAGGRAFNIAGNRCKNFLIGEREGGDLWLEGRVVADEFVFSGRLFMPTGQMATVIDRFPKAPAPDGWTQRRMLDADGYELIGKSGHRLFAYRVEGAMCVIDAKLYTAAGRLAAHSRGGGLVLHGIPYSFT